MDDRTGEIGDLRSLLKKGVPEENLIPLTDEQYRQLQPMNRKQRRAWAVKQRKEERRKNKKA